MAFTTQTIAPGFISIEQGYVRSFLIEGEKEALLIDTGVGGDNLKQFVKEITSLPITAIFTHADGDHVGNAGQFEKRFMHPIEIEFYQRKYENAVSMQPISEGDSIDVGTYCFEVLLLPGHTPGCIALLEKKKRFLIGADVIQLGPIFMFGKGRDFASYRTSLKYLESRRHEFDTIYASHYALSVPTDTISKLYEIAGMVIEQKIEGELESRFEDTIKSYRIDGLGFYAP